jgi:UV DNA damage endonuclease
VVDVIEICEFLRLPMVLDVHHHNCNPGGIDLKNDIQRVNQSWVNTAYPTKIHLSSPKEYKDDKRHADYIEVKDFYNALALFQEEGQDLDIMLECKMKDLALFKLIEDIKYENPLWQWEDETTLII